MSGLVRRSGDGRQHFRHVVEVRSKCHRGRQLHGALGAHLTDPHPAITGSDKDRTVAPSHDAARRARQRRSTMGVEHRNRPPASVGADTR